MLYTVSKLPKFCFSKFLYRTKKHFQFQFNGATYHSNLQILGGGVGRNIAEGISKLDRRVHFISVVGNDQVY